MTNPDIKNARILIVDDIPANVELLEKMLKIEGYTNIYSATDPRDTTKLYLEQKPDIVLLDLQMPLLDGFQVMELLKTIEKDSYLPILVLTGTQDRDTRLRALESGAKDFLNKPFDRLEVSLRIKNMLEVRLLHNQVRNQNVILEEKVRERTKELRETQFEVIQRLMHAAEFRDNETGMHIVRMSRFCALTGRTIGMSEKEAELLLHASPMHDIGKIGIPDRILLKPSKLNRDEWKLMKTHSAIGAKLLSEGRSDLMRMAQTIALTHHEKWDGTGYPNKLKGEQIPLAGRICGLCDVFDALTSERPYKKAWPVEMAVDEIKKGTGKHFAPDLVPVFLNILPEILKIREEHDEESKPAYRGG